MKRYFSIFLSVSILFSLLAGLGGVFATDTISITTDKTVLVVGQTANLTVTLPDGAENLSVDIDDESVVMFDPVSSTSTIRALKFGSAIITATCTVNGITKTDSVTIKVRTPRGLIGGEDYYVMNLQTGKFLAIPSGGDYDGVALRGVTRCSETYAQWTLEIAENGNGVTRLINASSSTGRALYVDSASDIVLCSSTSTTVRSQIALHRVESGTYQGKYLMRYNGKFVSMNSSNDIYLASSLNAGSYWTFMAVEKGFADFFNFEYYYQDAENTYFNTSLENDDFDNYFDSKGYNANYFTNDTVDYAYDCLSDGDVFIYYGHGHAATLGFETTGRDPTGYLYAYRGQKNEKVTVPQLYVSEIVEGSLASQRCVLYLGCLTAVDVEIRGIEYNIVDMTFEKGAHFVLGLTEESDVGYVDAWLDGFLNGIQSCQTIQKAIELGNNSLLDYSLERDGPNDYITALPIYTVGDSNQYLTY